MTDKEKYILLMERYFDAETSPEEEKALAAYAASTDDPAFAELRGVLGFLSIGRKKSSSKAGAFRWPVAAAVAAGLAAIVTVGIVSGVNDGYVSYAFGEKTTDSELVMESVNNSLTDFFAETTRAEASLAEIFGK